MGKVIGFALILGLIGLGAYLAFRPKPQQQIVNVSPQSADQPDSPTAPPDDSELVETLTAVAKLDAPGTYHPKDNVVDIELSEYAGYSGIIAYNNGLSPTENSGFFKNFGFKVAIKISEEESWSALNSGKMAASATTTDVLAAYGRQFRVTSPVQIGYSRGADALVVRSGISKVNDLKGKVIASCQFTEADFFIRYLAQDAGIVVNMLPDLNSKPDPESINLVFCETGLSAGDLLLKDVQGGHNRLAGCTSWSPKTEEIVEVARGKLKTLVTNRNLLIVSDILIVNKGFADAYPKMVAGLVTGVIDGNRMVTENPAQYYPVVEKAFKWDAGKAKDELKKIHFSNLPENLAYFSGEIDTAGSFSGIFQSAVLAYGSSLIPDPVNPESFINTKYLTDLNATGKYANQKVSIAPIKLGGGELERHPILSKNIRFLFQPTKADLEPGDQNNDKNIASIQQMLKVSPGSLVLLRGHVDDSQKPEFARAGEEQLRKGGLRAMKLSLDRANTVKNALLKAGVPADRIDTIGRGWEEPLGADKDQNRRVEVQWFTVE
jgi:NitT/TauT family transport system substrate-binding protein